MDISLAGMLGAMVGVIVSAAIYVPLVGAIESKVRHGQPIAERRSSFELELALLRRTILAADMLLCAGIGYWIGLKIGG